MQKQHLVEFARRLGLRNIDSYSRSGWVITSCPFARWKHSSGTDHSPSFGLKIGDNFAHCFSCHYASGLEEMLMQLGARCRGNAEAGKYIMAASEFLDQCEGELAIITAKDDINPNDILEPWPEWHIAHMLPAYTHPYLATRKGGPVPEAVASIMDIRWDGQKQRLGTPIRDFDGRLMGFHGRAVKPNKIPYLAYTNKKHWNRPIWLGEQWVDLSKPVVLAESVFDLARVLQVYRNAISPLMAGLPKSKIVRLSECMKIVTLFDNDEAGQLGLQKLKGELPDTHIVRAELPGQFKDAGECPPLALGNVLKPHVELDDVLM